MIAGEFDKAISEICNDNQEALKLIYREYYSSVLSLAFAILKNQQSAEDVAQEVFIKIWTDPGSYRPCKNPKAWIMEIAKNKAIDFIRKTKHETIHDFSDDSIGIGELQSENNITNEFEISEALLSLSEDECKIVVMHAVGGLTYITISRILNLPFGTVAWKYSRAIKKLRDICSEKNIKQAKSNY